MIARIVALALMALPIASGFAEENLPVGTIAFLRDPYSPCVLADSIESFHLYIGTLRAKDEEAYNDLIREGKIRTIGSGAKIQIIEYNAHERLYRIRLVGEGFTDQEFWVIEPEVQTK
jgi:hypothetical protein